MSSASFLVPGDSITLTPKLESALFLLFFNGKRIKF